MLTFSTITNIVSRNKFHVNILHDNKHSPSLQVQTNYVCGKQQGETLHIGSYNVFEVGTHVESLKIGSNNVFESKCKVSSLFLI